VHATSFLSKEMIKHNAKLVSYLCVSVWTGPAGCILLNPAMTKVVLVKSWKGNNRGLPKGKINQGEPAIAAAIREVGSKQFTPSGILSSG